ncbi:MAG: hypothetical protein WBO58_12590, partial [Gammaproteobacteria bacterium]
LGGDEEQLKKIALLAKEVPIEKLKLVYAIIEKDSDIEELNCALDRLILTRDKLSKKDKAAKK